MLICECQVWQQYCCKSDVILRCRETCTLIQQKDAAWRKGTSSFTLFTVRECKVLDGYRNYFTEPSQLVEQSHLVCNIVKHIGNNIEVHCRSPQINHTCKVLVTRWRNHYWMLIFLLCIRLPFSIPLVTILAIMKIDCNFESGKHRYDLALLVRFRSVVNIFFGKWYKKTETAYNKGWGMSGFQPQFATPDNIQTKYFMCVFQSRTPEWSVCWMDNYHSQMILCVLEFEEFSKLTYSRQTGLKW